MHIGHARGDPSYQSPTLSKHFEIWVVTLYANQIVENEKSLVTHKCRKLVSISSEKTLGLTMTWLILEYNYTHKVLWKSNLITLFKKLPQT